MKQQRAVRRLQLLNDVMRFWRDQHSIDHTPNHRQRAGRSGSVTTAAQQRNASEKAHRLGAITDQHVLGLLIVVQHHLMVLAANAGLFVATEGRVGGI